MSNNNYISDEIVVKGARENNLRNITVSIPRNKLTVITGVSGCGKSSLAFDVVYAEGSNRYLDSFSNYARRGETVAKPAFEEITNLSPAIAIQQRGIFRNPRSTVGTITEIYDYLRILFSSIGVPYSKSTGLPIYKQTQEQIIDMILKMPSGIEFNVVSHVLPGQDLDTRKALILLKKYCVEFIEIDGVPYPTNMLPPLVINKDYSVCGIFSSVILSENEKKDALVNLIKAAFKPSNGVISLRIKSSSITNIEEFADRYSSFLSGQFDQEHIPEYITLIFSEQYVCPTSNIAITKIEPRMFSFNSPTGVCKKCNGLGLEAFFSPELIVCNSKLSINDGAISVWHRSEENKIISTQQQKHYQQILEGLSAHYKFHLDIPYRALPAEITDMLMYGSNEEILMTYNDGYRTRKTKLKFNGVIQDLVDRVQDTENRSTLEELERYQAMKTCKACEGYRLSEEALCVRINKQNIGQICALSIRDTIEWFAELPKVLTQTELKIAEKVLFEVNKRLQLVADMGIDYLTLDRRTVTLSGGEAQRTKLATQIGSGLSGIIYVLDEPSIGLHQADNDLLIKQLFALRDLGNTLIIVEHDENMIELADHIIDIGPGAGRNGGKVIATGTPQEIAANPDSITGMYISGRMKVADLRQPRDLSKVPYIEVKNANIHNLQNVSGKIPLHGLVVVTGVSGSGKSTFVMDTFYEEAKRQLNGIIKTSDSNTALCAISGLENINKLIEVDQSAIGKTSRSNPATYTNIFTLIRDLYANLPESRLRGYNASRFSFNVRGGRCEKCEGEGSVRIEMYFMSDIHCVCDECNGSRYNQETLKIKYNGQSIADVLNMSVSEACEFFSDITTIKEKLDVLEAVGLGYIQLGQHATQLSGGEAQRLKLARELSKKSGSSTLYIFDEPTTGLHMHDIQRLVGIFDKLIEQNHSILVIEHNLHILKIADWIIDFGPYGGDRGGRIVAEGTPATVALEYDTPTSKQLRRFFE